MASGRRSIELRKTFQINSGGHSEGGTAAVSSGVEYSAWETYIATVIAKYRDGVILECLSELLSDEVSSHEAVTEGHISLLYTCLTDALEISNMFPVTEVSSLVSPLPFLPALSSLYLLLLVVLPAVVSAALPPPDPVAVPRRPSSPRVSSAGALCAAALS
jgi:hypothetical protein